MAIYTPVLSYTFRDTLGNADPNKVIKGAYLDGEFTAIHTASLDAASLSGANTFAGSNAFTSTNSFSQGVIITQPTSGNALTVTGVAGADAVLIYGAATGLSYGLQVQAGLTSADYAVYIGNQTNSHTYLLIRGDGSGNLGYGGPLQWSVNGNVTIPAPASGVPLVVDGASGTQVQEWTSTGAANALGVGWAVGVLGAYWNLFTEGTDPILIGTQGNAPLSLATDDATRFVLSSNGSSIQGYGPTAAALVDMTPDKSSWTTTLSGPYTVNPTGTVKWERQGTQVTLWVDANVTGTATGASTITASGLPAAVTPSSVRYVPCTSMESNSVSGITGQVGVNPGGTLTIYTNQVSGSTVVSTGTFAGSGLAGLQQGWSITYSL